MSVPFFVKRRSLLLTERNFFAKSDLCTWFGQQKEHIYLDLIRFDFDLI